MAFWGHQNDELNDELSSSLSLCGPSGGQVDEPDSSSPFCRPSGATRKNELEGSWPFWWPSGWPSAGLPGALLGRRLNGASAGARGRTGTMNENLVRRSGGLSGAPVLGHRLFFWGGGPRRTRLPLASEGRFKLLGAVFQPRGHQERAQDEKLPRPLPSRASKRRPPKF